MQTIQWPKIVVPGIVWGLILVGATIFLQQNFPDWEYLPWIVVVINAIIKAIEVNIGQPIPKPEGAEFRTMADARPTVEVKEANRLHRWLVA